MKDRFHNLNVRQPIAFPCNAHDLAALIGKMKQSRSWVRGELNNIVLLNSPEKQILLTALHKKQRWSLSRKVIRFLFKS